MDPDGSDDDTNDTNEILSLMYDSNKIDLNYNIYFNQVRFTSNNSVILSYNYSTGDDDNRCDEHCEFVSNKIKNYQLEKKRVTSIKPIMAKFGFHVNSKWLIANIFCVDR